MQQSTLVVTALFCLIVSLVLAWLASLILYARLEPLKSLFVAPHQLVRAHIDYLLMSMLLVMVYYLCREFSVVLAPATIALACLGALYNPVGFIALAVRPDMARPRTAAAKARVLLGFVPATLGFGGAAVEILLAMP